MVTITVYHSVPINPPTMQTNDATGIYWHTGGKVHYARLNGEVVATGGENPTRYYDWDDDASGTPYANEVDKGVGGVGAQHHTLTGLAAGTRHWFRFRGVNSGGTGNGADPCRGGSRLHH